MDEEEIKIKLDDGVDTSFSSGNIDLFVDLWEAQPLIVSGTRNDTVVS